jgi:hypothetical protein
LEKEKKEKLERRKKSFIRDKLGVIQYAHYCIFFFQSI